MKYVMLIAFVIFLVVLGPIFLIWSLNTLFPILNIPYTFDTWVAVMILSGLFKTTVKVNK